MKILNRVALVAMLLSVASAFPAAAADAPMTHYVLDPAKSSLEFNFLQAGAQNKGRFRHFTVAFDFSPDNLAASHLEVTVDVPSLDTGDQERDDTLKDADLFSAKKFPQAVFRAQQIVKTATGYEAVGKLTIRDITRDLRVPFTFRTAPEGAMTAGYMAGKTALKRLDYGVGQGEWKATDQVSNDVSVAFALRLTPH
ncbi:MAG: YceI family protein [Proteobacteria bacterium]|nr:YceI family protein [Pseudomonadota bacterium]